MVWAILFLVFFACDDIKWYRQGTANQETLRELFVR